MNNHASFVLKNAALLLCALVPLLHAGAQVVPTQPRRGVPLSRPDEAVVAAEAIRVVRRGESIVFRPSRVCRSDLVDDECPSGAPMFKGPAHHPALIQAVRDSFGTVSSHGDTISVQMQRPLLHNDTIHVLVYVTRRLEHQPSADVEYFDMDEYDVRLLMRTGIHLVISAKLLSVSEVLRTRRPAVDTIVGAGSMRL